jgi:hypothetical protein
VLIIIGFLTTTEFSYEQQSLDSTAAGINQEKLFGEYSEIFMVNSNGQIFDGPRRGNGEEVDYSAILNDNLLAYVFAQSVFGCLDSTSLCGEQHFLLRSNQIGLAVISNSSNANNFEEKMIKIFDNTLGEVGFTALDAHTQDMQSLTIVTGDLDYIRSYAAVNSSPETNEFFSFLDWIPLKVKWLCFFSPVL